MYLIFIKLYNMLLNIDHINEIYIIIGVMNGIIKNS
jgi:hypothetical protein